jgi:hypothetical protein
MPRCYLICANARCGSTLLSRALSDTGVAGHPDEYFVTGPPEAFSPGSTFWEDGALALQHGVNGREEFLRLVYRVGSTPNGVFGAKPCGTTSRGRLRSSKNSHASGGHRAETRGRANATDLGRSARPEGTGRYRPARRRMDSGTPRRLAQRDGRRVTAHRRRGGPFGGERPS